MNGFRAIVWTMLGAIALCAAFLLGRWSIRRQTESLPQATASETACPGSRQMEALRRFVRNLPPPSIPRPPGEPADEDLAVAEARASHAHTLLAKIFGQLEQQARLGIMQAEGRSTLMVPHLDGVLQGALEVDPGIRSAFSKEFTTLLCAGDLADDQATTLAHMAMMLPDIATSRGIDCFLGKAKEGVPFWTMLDAWRGSGLPSTDIIDKIRASATDPRTVRRFLSAEEALAQRTSATPTSSNAGGPASR
jgi:hypothetical protein